MSDARDTNHDGKVSLMEKVKDKLHLGHHNSTQNTHSSALPATHGTSGSHHSAALPAAGAVAGTALAGEAIHHHNQTSGLNHSSALPGSSYGGTSTLSGSSYGSTSAVPATGVMPAVMPMAAVPVAGMQGTTGFGQTGLDSRDLNGDGRVSMGEKLASGTGAHNTGAYGAGFAGETMGEEARLRLHEEQLAISKREVGAGAVDIHKRVHEQHVQETIPVKREEVIVERRPLSGIAEPGAVIAPQDETMRVALFREELVTEKRIVPTEEVIVRKKEVIDQQTVGATLLSEHVETMQTGTQMAGGAYGGAMTGSTGAYGADYRDTNRDGHVSAGEKLKSGNLQNSAFDNRDRNGDGRVTTGEKLESAALGNHGGLGNNMIGNNMTGSTGAYGADYRDTNRDGHVSMGEKLKSGNPQKSAFDNRDLNGDGRVTMGEKLETGAINTALPKAARG